jgi:ribosomal protein S18 acetylase RimI-like enzyme
MVRTLLRMVSEAGLEPADVVGAEIRPWDRSSDHPVIPTIYAGAFGHDPWPDDWDGFDEFDPDGVFIAETADGPVGFCLCFPRNDEGYISVVAVLPAHRRRGIASALVRQAVGRFRSLGLETVRVDAYEDAAAAVATYRSLGFEVYDVVEDREADPRGAGEE